MTSGVTMVAEIETMHGLLAWTLSKANLATITSECPTCQKERPVLNSQCGTILWGTNWPLGDKLTSLGPTHAGRPSNLFSQEQTFILSIGLHFLPAELQPIPLYRSLQSTWSIDQNPTYHSIQPGDPLHSEGGLGVVPWSWDMLVLSHTTLPRSASLREWQNDLLMVQMKHHLRGNTV